MTIGKQIGPERGNRGKKPQNRKSEENPFSGPIWFPILARRTETYFLAGRLDLSSLSYLGRLEVGP